MIRVLIRSTGEYKIVSVPYGSYLVLTGLAMFADENIRYVKSKKG